MGGFANEQRVQNFENRATGMVFVRGSLAMDSLQVSHYM